MKKVLMPIDAYGTWVVTTEEELEALRGWFKDSN